MSADALHDISPTNPRPDDAIETAVFDNDEFKVILFDDRTRALHSLSPSASAVWMLCDGRTTAAMMVTELSELFSLDVDIARISVSEALGSFWNAGHLEGSPDPRLEPTESSPSRHRVLPRLHDP